MSNLNRSQRILSILSPFVLGLAMSCTGNFGSDDFEEAENPATLTAAHLTIDNSGMSASYETLDASRKRVTCQFTNFIGEVEVVASLLGPNTAIDFLQPTTEGATPALSITEESVGQFEATYIVEDSSYFDLKFNCRGEVRQSGQTVVREDTVRFFQLKSLYGAVRGANFMNLNKEGQPASAFQLNADNSAPKKPKIALRNPGLEAEPLEKFFGETVAQACVTENWIYYYDGALIARGKPAENLVQKFAGDITEATNSNNRLRINIRNTIIELRGSGSSNLNEQKLSCSDQGVTVWSHITGDTESSTSPEKVLGIEFLKSTIVPEIHVIPTVTGSEVLQYPSSTSGFVVLQDDSGIYKANKTQQQFDQIAGSSISSAIPELNDVVAAQSGTNNGFAYAQFMGAGDATYEFLSAGIYRVCTSPGSCTDSVRTELERKTFTVSPTGAQPQVEILKNADYTFTDTLELETLSGEPGNAPRMLKTIVIGGESSQVFESFLQPIEYDFTQLRVTYALFGSEKDLLRQFGQYRYDSLTQKYFEARDDKISFGEFTSGTFVPTSSVEFEEFFPGQNFIHPDDTMVIHLMRGANAISQNSDVTNSLNYTIQESSLLYSFIKKNEIANFYFVRAVSFIGIAENSKYIDAQAGFSTVPAAIADDRVLLSSAGFVDGSLAYSNFALSNGNVLPAIVSHDASQSFDVDLFIFETAFLGTSTLAHQDQVQARINELEESLPGCKDNTLYRRNGDGYIYFVADCGGDLSVHQVSKDGGYFHTTLPAGSAVEGISGDEDRFGVVYTSLGKNLKIINKASGIEDEISIPTGGFVKRLYMTSKHIYLLQDSEISTAQIGTSSGLSLSAPEPFFGNSNPHFPGSQVFLPSGCNLSSRDFVAKDVNTLANNMAKFCSGTVLDMHMLRVSPKKSKLVVMQRLRDNLNFMEINIKDL